VYHTARSPKPYVKHPHLISLESLLPEFILWYNKTSDSKEKRYRLREILDSYNQILEEFNLKTSKAYHCRRSLLTLRSWIYQDQKDYTPTIDEVMVLAKAFGVNPSKVQTRYIKEFKAQVLESLEALK
jgi:hypothetical protein